MARWLGVGDTLQLVRGATPPSWKAIAQRSTPDGGTEWLLHHRNKEIWLQLQVDDSTTFADIYKLHVRPTPLTSPQIDMDVVLGSDPDVWLFDRPCVSVYGDLNTTFTMVRRISNESVGGFGDTYDPLGRPHVGPVGFTNGSEAHFFVTTAGCPGSQGLLVSQLTGRCLRYSAQRGLPKFGYEQCDNLHIANKCWELTPSGTPHDAANVDLEGSQLTLSFDDSGLPPQDGIIAPVRSNDTLFLQPNASTDVYFDIQLQDTGYHGNTQLTSMRLYSEAGLVASMPNCVAKKTDSNALFACQSPCTRATATSPYQCSVSGTGSQLQLAECQAECFPTLVNRSKESAMMHMDIVLEKMTTGVRLRKRDWTQNAPGPCLVSNLESTEPAILQLANCNNFHQDYFQLLPKESEEGATSHVVYSLGSDKCVGYQSNPLTPSDDSLALVSCTSPNTLRVIHSFKDDGDLFDGPTASMLKEAHMELPEGVLMYTSDDSSAQISVYFYRHESRGTLRVTVGFADVAGSVVSLVDYTGALSPAPSTHRYVVKFEQNLAPNNLQRQTIVLLRNGTVVDKSVRTVESANKTGGCALSGLPRLLTHATSLGYDFQRGHPKLLQSTQQH